MTDSHLGYLHRAQRWYQHILPVSNSVLLTLNLLDIDSGSPGYCLHFMIGSPVNDCCTDGSICFSWTCWQCHRLCLESSEIQIRTSLQNFHHKCPAVMKCICNHDQRAPIVLKTELSRNSRSVIRQVVCISCELRKALDCCVITAFSTGPSENCSHFEPHNSEKKQKNTLLSQYVGTASKCFIWSLHPICENQWPTYAVVAAAKLLITSFPFLPLSTALFLSSML